MNKTNKFLLAANISMLILYALFAFVPRTVEIHGDVDAVVNFDEMFPGDNRVDYSIENLEVTGGLYFHSLPIGVGILVDEKSLPENPEVFYCVVRGLEEISVPDCHF